MKSIKHTVQSLTKRYKTNDPFEIASQKNIYVFYEPLGVILGYFHVYKRIPMIHINSDLRDEEKRFVCAHELGHSILHQKVNTPFLKKNTLFSIDKIEREANEFAVELLLPDTAIRDLYGLPKNKISAITGIPEEFIHLKKF
jgi:Zn-dependent peptidase ImmA (M78 family)